MMSLGAIAVAISIHAAPACATCHPGEAAQWKKSLHATADTNPLFVASFNRSHLEWCLDCHAPKLDGKGPRTAGIDCEACHVKNGLVVTSVEPTEAGKKAHAETQDVALRTSAQCEGCHQFNVPRVLKDPVQLTDMPMQNTAHEHDTSWASARGLTCQSCHMQKGTHDIQGGHDAELLRKTVDLKFAPTERGWVATLEAKNAGHRVPTGDPFRRFEVLICATATCDDVVFTKLRFGRTLRPKPGGGWVEARDTSVPVSQTRTASSPPQRFEAPAEGFFWTMRYRMDESGLSVQVPRDAYQVEVSNGQVTQGATSWQLPGSR